MAPRKKRRRRQAGALSGLCRRGEVYYWQREHERMGRVYRSLGTRDLDTANGYAGSLQKLMERGDWDVLRRFAEGKLHISTIERAVREGDWQSLRRLHASGPILGEQRDLFLARVGATRRESTEETRRASLRLAVEHFGAERPMHTITKADAETYLHADRGGKAWSANTQASHAAALTLLWAFTMGRELEEAEQHNTAPWVKSNPWRDAERPAQDQTRFSFFTPEQARRLLAHESTAGTPREALLTTAFDGGLRRGELAYLRTAIDLDFEAGYVHVQSRGGEHAWKPKTKRGERKVPMTPRMRASLERHIAAGFAGERYVFRSETADAPPNPSTVAKWARASIEAAGYPYGRSGEALTLHSTRHSFATWLLEHGTPVPLVARLMGDRVESVLRTYAHCIPDLDRIAVKVLDDLAEGRPAAAGYGRAQ